MFIYLMNTLVQCCQIVLMYLNFLDHDTAHEIDMNLLFGLFTIVSSVCPILEAYIQLEELMDDNLKAHQIIRLLNGYR